VSKKWGPCHYLIEKLSEQYPWLREVYKNTSGFIHLSDKHIISTFQKVANDRSSTISIGPSSEHIPEGVYNEAIMSFMEATTAVCYWINSWTFTKNRPTTEQKER